jgi:hypothetical protein
MIEPKQNFLNSIKNKLKVEKISDITKDIEENSLFVFDNLFNNAKIPLILKKRGICIIQIHRLIDDNAFMNGDVYKKITRVVPIKYINVVNLL